MGGCHTVKLMKISPSIVSLLYSTTLMYIQRYMAKNLSANILVLPFDHLRMYVLSFASGIELTIPVTSSL